MKNKVSTEKIEKVIKAGLEFKYAVRAAERAYVKYKQEITIQFGHEDAMAVKGHYGPYFTEFEAVANQIEEDVESFETLKEELKGE